MGDGAERLPKLDLVARHAVLGRHNRQLGVSVQIPLSSGPQVGAAVAEAEEGRSAETDKWLAFPDTAAARDKARLSLLKHTGALLTALN